MEAKFSPRVKDVISYSREEALRLGHDYIGTEHLLLGLIREGDGMAIKILKGAGIDTARVRKSVEDSVKGGAQPATLPDAPPQSPPGSPPGTRPDWDFPSWEREPKPETPEPGPNYPFPKPEDIVYEALPTPMPFVETPAPAWSPVPYKRPGRCESNSTQRVPLYPDADTNPTKKEGDPDEKELLYDYLFIAEDLVPYDSTEVFGLDTVLRPYGPKSGEAVYTRMEIYNVPCVPYRIRMTNKAHYYDTGLNALKNYDGRHSGVGVLSKWMTLKLYGAR